MNKDCICILFMVVSLVIGQSDFMCPPNTKMGLCEPPPSPCVTDADCIQDHICCPHACSRTCKPKNNYVSQVGGSSASASQVPDLLNDPRVYVGRCPDSSCFALFPEPNECSTSKLCPQEQYCCNDGCKNVCLIKPEYAALMAQQEAKQRQQQQIMYQKQQEELMRRQQEMLLQQQRQIALAEQAMLQAKARATAEAELAAQQARAKYEKELQLKAEAQAAKQKQQLAQQQAAALLQQQMQEQQQQQQQQPNQQQTNSQTPASSSGYNFLDNFVDGPQTMTGTNTELPARSSKFSELTGRPTGTQGAHSGDKSLSLLAAQLNSPASANPYSSAHQQNVYSKSDYLPPVRSETQERLIRLILPQGSASGSPPRPAQRAPQAVQRVPQQMAYPNSGYPYPQANQSPVRQQGSVDPYLMFHFMQTAA
ncbi:alpha-protein kinase 1 [Biomphalaria glabrata]|uniref:Serum response factor homolog A-like n=1 Tax=Biomphalaria glabrata TaxID=6526 RepID=A0A9W2ZEB5_BIOGL|nr:serum response factor homolog A-like [Biomphalaria glabrata]XP_055873293.1 serum response factor homolog A-like [Biomphalaria glabrata]KAI8785804.1 alpha-protein kinase 1 [Biomphalaria glabrata]